MRIVTVRRVSQVFFLIVFLWFCVAATVGAAWWQLRGWPINWILDLDPLTSLATVLATGTLYATLAWSLVAIVGTLVVGRFFCGFACPLGTINQATGWVARRGQTGIIDPLPLVYRSVNLALAPLADNRLGLVSGEPRFYASAWFIGVVFLGVVGLNLVLPRFFCRFICPLGPLFPLAHRENLGQVRGLLHL